jgi:phage regulator Rha-like protein
MHQLIATNNSSMKMTSREMADLTEKRHDSVKRTIETLLSNGVIQSPQIVNFKNSNNVEGYEYVFTGEQGKRDSIIVVAQLSPEFTARLVDRWQELESKTSAVLPSDPIMAQIAILQSVREQQIALESGHHVLAVGIAETRNDVNNLKQNMRIENWQQCNIKTAVHHKAAQFQDLYPHANYGDIIRKIWRYFKNKFSIPRYQELPAMMYEEAMKTIHGLAMHNLAGL